MSLTYKLKNAGFWQMLKVGGQAIIQFGYMAIMARLLTKADFGLMAIAMSFIGFGTIFSEGGMGSALIQRQNVTQKHMNAAFQASVLIGGVVFLLFYSLAFLIADYFNEYKLELIIKVAGVNIILNAISSVSQSLLQKHFRFKLIATYSFIITVIAYGSGVFFAYQDYGVWSLIIATLIHTILNSIIMFYLAPIKISFRFHLKEWKELFSFASGIILLKIINYFSSSGLNLVLGKIFTPAKLGVFERSNSIKTLPSSYLGNVLDTIMFPAMAEIQNEEERLFKTYQHSLGMVNSVLMPIALFLIVFSKEVVLILLGDQWMDAIVPLQIMFVVLPFSSSGRMADSVVRAKGMVYKNVYRKAIYTVVLVTCVALGGYYYGLIGAAIGVMFSYLFNYMIMLILVKSIFEKNIKEIFYQPIVSGLIITLVLLPIILLSVFISSHIYYTPVLYIIVNSVIIGAIMFLILWRKPVLMGVYLSDTVFKLRDMRKTTKNEDSYNR